jgi:soluble lytic murein transglycosylase-like protein
LNLTSGHSLAIGLAVTLMTGTAALAQGGSPWGGSAVYEVAAPTPQAAEAATPIAKMPVKIKHGAHERAAAVHRRNAVPVTVAREADPAPTPTETADVQPSPGPVENPAPTIRDLISKHARANGVPEKLADAVVNIESRFNPKARGGSALGLMQIKYDTARSMGYAGGVTALLTPETNLQFGMKVLADAYRSSNGDICMTLARYQSGHRVTHASAANRAYCARARSYMARAD